jgi:predicted CXXCH cytochrome family protein
MRKARRLSLVFFLLFFLLLISGLRNVWAGQIDCVRCHGELVQKKVVHPAVAMGCTVCHTGIDASSVPHKITGKARLGLFADVPDLCYGCHDRKMFEGKYVHPPVAGGMCIMCHDPHSADSAHLLAQGIPDLCYQCHDKKQFTKKHVHPPVAEGKCMTCHRPHEADRKFLLVKRINNLCLGCHAEVARGVHAVETFGPGGGHPVETKTVVNVGRKKMKLSCVSCHNPHSSSWRLLFQFQPPICEKCHRI